MCAAPVTVTPFPAVSRYRPEGAAALLAHALPDAWRKPALDMLKARGLPNPKLERWKYTNLLAFERAGCVPAEVASHDFNDWMLPNSTRILCVNGYVVLGAALVGDLQKYLTDGPMARFDDGMCWALNQAFTVDGPLVRVSGTGHVFEIVNLAVAADTAQLSSPYSVFALEAGAEATIIERFIGTDHAGLVHSNHALHVTCAPNAKLNHIRVQHDVPDRTMLCSSHVQVARDAHYNYTGLHMGSALMRTDIWVELMGPQASCSLSAAHIIGARQHMDTMFHIEHQAPHTTSNQVVKNIVAGEAKGVFQGKVHVHQVAQKTDGYQLCNTVLLGPRAEMNTKPELEIYADDVKCSHGTTTGQLDADPLFYLQARGIPAPEARTLLLMAFVGAVLDGVRDETVQGALMTLLEDRVRDVANSHA